MNLFGVGAAEAGLVFVIALIVVGPQRFPEIMRQAGRWYRVARAYSNEVMKDVRAAVDEIEQEVKAETDDIRSVGDFSDLKGDLIEARESAEDIRKDTTAAARTGPVRPSQAKTPLKSETATPAPAAGASETADTSEHADSEDEGTAGKPGTPSTPAAKPAPASAARPATPADPPASYYEGRDPSTYDPFKAKEARERERAAARDDAESTNGTS